MSILTRSWNSNCTRPIITHMRQFITQFLQMIRTQIRGIHYNKMGRRHRTLSDILTHQKEILIIRFSHFSIHDRTWHGIVQGFAFE